MITSSLLIHPDEVSKKWIDRLAANSVSVLGIHPVGGRQAHLSLQELIEQQKDPACRALYDYAAERGLRVEYGMHAMRYLLPAEEFDAHPDWFRMDENGVRIADLNCCSASEEALDHVAESAAKLAKALYRSTNRYFFWLDDAKGAFCHCPKCAALSPSDQQMKILNRIIRRLRQDDPEATLAYLAYCDTIAPPTVIRPEEGIFLEYAPYERDFHAPIRGNAQADPILALLDCFGREGARVLDYWYDNSYYSGYKKPPAAFAPDRVVIEDDLDYYVSLGFADIAGFACFLGEDYEALHGEPDIGDLGAFMRKTR